MDTSIDKSAQKNEISRAENAPIPIAQMMQLMIEKGITADNVQAMEQLVKLQERIMDRDAEKEFANAFAILQSQMQSVNATKAIPSKDGSIRSRFAPYEEIMEQVGPLMNRLGFTVTFDTDYSSTPPMRVIQKCTLQHTSGHKRTNSFAVRIGNGPPGASEAQGDGAAATFAKRYALCAALNITIDFDTDAKTEGATITKEEAQAFEARAVKLNIDRVKILKWLHAASFEEISEAGAQQLDEELTRREREVKK